jgi:hypothetical protein
MPKSKTRLPEAFSSIEEIQQFWDTHSTADYWDEMQDVEMELTPELQAKFESQKLYRLLELSPQQIDTIEHEAQQEQIDSRRLISKWVLEHVQHGALS